MTSDPSPVLARCVAALEASLAPNSALLVRLKALRDRLQQERFRLAALGQFKRGKSTLLNALIGASALPVTHSSNRVVGDRIVSQRNLKVPLHHIKPIDDALYLVSHATG